jgi:hypothetical protein
MIHLLVLERWWKLLGDDATEDAQRLLVSLRGQRFPESRQT